MLRSQAKRTARVAMGCSALAKGQGEEEPFILVLWHQHEQVLFERRLQPVTTLLPNQKLARNAALALVS
eukprot:3191508-Amphidinium_carterae.1